MGWGNKIQQAVFRHAKEDMAASPGMAQMRPDAEPATFMEWVKANHARQPSLWSELAAMTREAIKDVRQTVNEVFFGKGEHAPEPGTPLNPTQMIITAEAGNFPGYNDMQSRIYEPPSYNPEQAAQRSKGDERGLEMSR
jgi:hypothetical protein